MLKYRDRTPQPRRDRLRFDPGARLEARVHPRKAGLYPDLDNESWYRVRPDGLQEDGTCWVIGYGTKQRVKVADFDIRQVD